MYNWLLSNPWCGSPQHQFLFLIIVESGTVGALPDCVIIVSDAEQPDISTNGLSCGALTMQDISEGIRIMFSTACTVTAPGPVQNQ